MSYTINFTKYQRRKTRQVSIKNIHIGGTNKVNVQTMTNTLTGDIDKTAQQVVSSYNAGAEIVRITVPSKKDVENIKSIKQRVAEQGYDIPLVADIHFNQQIAFEAAKIVEKVRINPGNFADSKKDQQLEYTNDEYKKELSKVEEAFIPLLDICKEHNTALRIGSNHGSLSDRIMSRYGDTPEGMAESAMEFLRICQKESFSDVVISMKSSNTRIMVQAVRLLVHKMNTEGMDYPIHLGVTEAGEGEDGRIKSAVGVGALLMDGIGDTIRISLTEPPENEIPVAQKLVNYVSGKADHGHIDSFGDYPIDPFVFKRRRTSEVQNIGGSHVPVVLSGVGISNVDESLKPDYIIADYAKTGTSAFRFVRTSDITTNLLEQAKKEKLVAWILTSDNKNPFADFRSAIFRMMNAGLYNPVILHQTYNDPDLESFQVKAATDMGGLFLDGLADGIWVENTNDAISPEDVNSTAFGILQASRMRMSRTEYISCPSCGRTMFDIQGTTQMIRQKTAHLKGLKIGIMGCIVNGLGEMADADYGYVGFGSGKINLYHNKELYKRGIPQEHAVGELINLIKEKGDWHEPS